MRNWIELPQDNCYMKVSTVVHVDVYMIYVYTVSVYEHLHVTCKVLLN